MYLRAQYGVAHETRDIPPSDVAIRVGRAALQILVELIDVEFEGYAVDVAA